MPLESSDHGPSQLDPGGNAPGKVLGSGLIDVAIGAVVQVDEPVGRVDGSVVEGGAQVTLKSLQIEQEHHAALEVDRYAEVLLSELGVSERGLHSLASTVAGVKTARQRPGFVGAEKLARNWKIGVEAAKRTVGATMSETSAESLEARD